jgi:hypothetical protein
MKTLRRSQRGVGIAELPAGLRSRACGLAHRSLLRAFLLIAAAMSHAMGCGSAGDRPDSFGGGPGGTPADGTNGGDGTGGSGGDNSSDGSGNSGGSGGDGGDTDPAVVDCVVVGNVTTWPKASSNSTRTVGLAVVNEIFHVVYGDRSPALHDELWERIFSGGTAGGAANLIANSAPNANSVRLRFDAAG